jgi:hypothetical protein
VPVTHEILLSIDVCSLYVPDMPHAPDHPPALHAARKAVAGARPESRSLLALILALLLRLFARKDVAWSLLEDEALYDHEAVYNPRAHAETDFDAFAFCGVDPDALHPRPLGRAPHAIWVEAGLVPDWILPGIRNRAMRPHARPMDKKPSPLGGEGWVRGPPPPPRGRNPPAPKTPSGSRAPTHAHSHSIIKTIPRLPPAPHPGRTAQHPLPFRS